MSNIQEEMIVFNACFSLSLSQPLPICFIKLIYLPSIFCSVTLVFFPFAEWTARHLHIASAVCHGGSGAVCAASHLPVGPVWSLFSGAPTDRGASLRSESFTWCETGKQKIYCCRIGRSFQVCLHHFMKHESNIYFFTQVHGSPYLLTVLTLGDAPTGFSYWTTQKSSWQQNTTNPKLTHAQTRVSAALITFISPSWLFMNQSAACVLLTVVVFCVSRAAVGWSAADCEVHSVDGSLRCEEGRRSAAQQHRHHAHPALRQLHRPHQQPCCWSVHF